MVHQLALAVIHPYVNIGDIALDSGGKAVVVIFAWSEDIGDKLRHLVQGDDGMCRIIAAIVVVDRQSHIDGIDAVEGEDDGSF